MIPKIIHQIWIGGIIPPKFFDIMKTTANTCTKFGYEYVFWDEESLLKEFPTCVDMFNLRNEHPAQQADIFRIMVVEKFGGFYLDCDCELLDSIDHICNCDYVTNTEGITKDEIPIYSYFFGSVSNGNMITYIKNKIYNNKDINLPFHNRVGYIYCNRLIQENLNVDTILLSPSHSYFIKHHFHRSWRIL